MIATTMRLIGLRVGLSEYDLETSDCERHFSSSYSIDGALINPCHAKPKLSMLAPYASSEPDQVQFLGSLANGIE